MVFTARHLEEYRREGFCLIEAMFSRELESFHHGEVEFALLHLDDRLRRSQCLPNRAQDAQTAFDPVRPDGIGNW